MWKRRLGRDEGSLDGLELGFDDGSVAPTMVDIESVVRRDE
jgi:hypothetical protein